MQTQLILGIISDDKPGVVERLAHCISQNGGNWLESRFTHLADKFAGILLVAVDSGQVDQLQTALLALNAQGFKLQIDFGKEVKAQKLQQFHFSVIGGDRRGIVHEVAQAFAKRKINLSELETQCSSMPWSGEPMFEATGLIQIPNDVDMDDLQSDLDLIADELAVDIRIETHPEVAHH